MSIPISLFYSILGLSVFMIGFCGVILTKHLLKKVLAINFMGTGIFMFFIAMAHRHVEGMPDPVPHAMVLTGIVVAVSATALILALVVRYHEATGEITFGHAIKKDKKDFNS